MERLPDFANPPVVEVAVAVGFQPLAGLRVVDLGGLWERYQADFPNVVEQPPIEMTTERFDGLGAPPSMSFALMAAPPIPRLWFLNGDESQLIQVQNNWFARNWRKMPTGGDYPRYPTIRDRFRDDLSTFLDYIRAGKLGEFKPTQCEITFINHIADYGGQRQELSEILNLLKPLDVSGFLPSPESVGLNAQFLIAGDGVPAGRLHLRAEPAVRRSDGSPITVLTITARGVPIGEGVEGVMGFLELGHTWVVRGFECITTDRMHKLWGKTND
jgi:uncharacterized protein (TIGR04255 family)